MGIEVISGACLSFGNVGSIGLGVASSVGRIGAGVATEAAPAVASLGKFGRVMGSVDIGPIINEGQVALTDFKNIMSLPAVGFDKVKEIRFGSPVNKGPSFEPLSEGAVVAEAKHWLGIAEPKLSSLPSWEVIVPIAVSNGLEYPKPQVIVSPSWEVQPWSQSKTESRISSQTAQVVLSAPATKEQAVEELVERKVKAEEPREILGEEEIMERRLYLEDQEALVVRRFEIRRAIKLAFTIVGNLVNVVTGAMVARFLPAEHEGNRSQVVKKTGPDGSYQETVEAITDAGELESEDKAVTRFDEIVAEKKPVKVGKNGNPVANQDVARVFKYHVVKPAQAYVEVVRRVIKKGVNTILPGSNLSIRPHFVQDPQGWTEVGQEEANLETNMEDLGLAEIFQSSA